MKKEQIIEKLSTKIAQDILEDEQRVISSTESLISSGLIDSFSLVDLALIVEDNFGVIIDDAELTSDNFDSLDQLAQIIIERKGSDA